MIPLKPPTYQTSEPAFGPSYLANRYEYKLPSPRSILVSGAVMSKYGSGIVGKAWSGIV